VISTSLGLRHLARAALRACERRMIDIARALCEQMERKCPRLTGKRVYAARESRSVNAPEVGMGIARHRGVPVLREPLHFLEVVRIVGRFFKSANNLPPYRRVSWECLSDSTLNKSDQTPQVAVALMSPFPRTTPSIHG
jgi:hypothetical protein